MSVEENAESKYEVREVIGKGAFGEVNLVVEKHTKQRFVLKRIKMARQSEWQRKATRQEIEIVSRLRHPFIMPYKEHWTHHGHTINVVYGYCEKGDLTTAITKQKGKYFPEETLRLWLAELLLAVDYMHRQHVLHRDIKTQNILLTGDGDVQVGDFGLSTVRVPSTTEMAERQKLQQISSDDTDPCIDSSPAHGDMGSGAMAPSSGAVTPEPAKVHHALATAHVPPNPAGAEAYTTGLANAHANGYNAHNHVGDKDKDQVAGHTPVHDPKAGTRNDYSLVGTPHFMSPELLSSQKYSYETDIWSLGVVMYELTTLKPPFNAFNLAGLVAKIKRAALPPIPPCYSADWTAILKSMLRKDPTRRASPLDLLAVPTMQQALHQARQRAQAISPDFVMPEIPVLDNGVSPGFCFDIGGGAGAGVIGAEQRTPTAVGPATPVLLNAQGGSGEDLGGTVGAEPESSPLSKFPDLGSADSPLQAGPVPASSGVAAAAAAMTVAQATTAGPTAAPPVADGIRSKTPATSRRPGAAGAAASTVPAPAAAAARRPMSPQRTRGAPVVGGAPRSKTPGRAFGTGAASTKAEAEPSSRIVRKATLPRESRSRSTLPGMSPRNLSGGGAAGNTADAPLQTARAASPTEAFERPSGRRAGPNSGPAPRVAPLGSLRGGSGKRSLLDTVGQHAVAAAPASTSAAAFVAHVSMQNDVEGEAASPITVIDADAAADVAKIASPSSTGIHKTSSPAAPTGLAGVHTTAAGGAGGRAAPWRAARSFSLTTTRTSRAALAAGSSPPQASPTAADATGHGAGGRRPGPVSVARGGSTDPTTGAAAAAAATNAAHPKRIPVTAGDSQHGGSTKRAGAAAEGPAPANGPVSSRPRGGGSPQHRTTAAPAPVSAAITRWRSQPGMVAGAAKDSTEASGSRQPEKRVRRSSYVSYGKPTESATLQRRPLASSHATGSAVTARESASAAVSTAATAVTAAAANRDFGLLSSHPLVSSDAALESCPASASGSPPENPATAWDPSTASIDVSASITNGVTEYASKPAPPGDGDTAAAAATVREVETEATRSAAVIAGNGAPGASHPWRLAPRSRSLLSMTTEDSELSIPDGRYGPSESNGAAYDGETAPAATGFAAVPSTITAAIAPSTSIQPLWSSNQLFSGSYGSCAGSLTDIGAQPAAAAPSAVGTVSLPAGGIGSARPAEPIGSLGGTATISADLPYRVSASAFAPHLLYGNAPATALADASVAGGTESEASTPADAPRGGVLAGFQRLALDDPTASAGGGGDNQMQLVSPGRFDLVSAGAGVVTYSPSGLTSATASPLSARYGGASGGMEIISPTAVTEPQYSRHGNGFNNQHTRLSGPALDAQQGANGWQSSGAEGYYDTSPRDSSGSASPTHLNRRDEHEGNDDVDAAAATYSSSEVTSQLRPVQEDVDGEAESEPAAQLHSPYRGAELSGSERAQLALLQRVVALAGSLWEMGRDAEIGAVLSSTLSRPLMRRPDATGPPASAVTVGGDPTWTGSTGEQQQPSRQRQSRVPELGDAVRVTSGRLRGAQAVVRYRGPCHWGAGTVLGLELTSASSAGQSAEPGRADKEDLHGPPAPPGCRDGVRYFRCSQAKNEAAFVATDQVVLVE